MLLPLLSGVAAKIYDDLIDNPLLKKFRNDTFIDFIKGVHYIAFTATSVQEPLFFIIFAAAIVLNFFGNPDNYNDSYEYSLLFSFMLLFFVIDYTKIKPLPAMDLFFMVATCVTLLMEPIIMTTFFENIEFSYPKMVMRASMLVVCIVTFFLATSGAIKSIFMYLIGYDLVSTMVQYYSLKKKKLDFKFWKTFMPNRLF